MLAIPSVYLGASILAELESQNYIINHRLLGKVFSTTPIKLTVGLLMIFFACLEVIPSLKNISIDQKFLPLGGILSGFFGGLTGNQGTFRSMFLIRANLTKNQFIATGSAFSFFVDLTRLSVYFKNISTMEIRNNIFLLIFASASALIGVLIRNRVLKKVDMKVIRYLVAVMIFAMGTMLILGII